MRTNDEVSLANALAKMIKNMNLTDEVKRHRIFTVWNTMMGEAINKHVTNISFTKGVLFVHISSAPLRHELFMSRSKLKQRLNEELKEDWIQNIILK